MATETMVLSVVCILASFILLVLSAIVISGGRKWSRIVFFTWLLTKSVWLAAGAFTYLATTITQFEMAQNIFYSLLFPISMLIPVFSISFTSEKVKRYYTLALASGLFMMFLWFIVRPYNVFPLDGGFNYLMWDIVVIPMSIFITFSIVAGVLSLWKISGELKGDMQVKLRRLAFLIFLHMATTLPFGFYGHLISDSTYVPAISGVFDSIVFTLMLIVYLD